MEFEHKDILRKNHAYLIENVVVEDIQDLLFQEEVLTSDELEHFSHSRSRTKQSRELLRMLPTKGPKAFKIFCSALVEKNKRYVVEKLCPLFLAPSDLDESAENMDILRKLQERVEFLEETRLSKDDVEEKLKEVHQFYQQRLEAKEEKILDLSKRVSDLETLIKETNRPVLHPISLYNESQLLRDS